MGSDRRPAADVAVGVTSGDSGAPCGLAATNAGHGCLTLTGSATGQAGQFESTRRDGSVQFGSGHGGEGLHWVGV